MRISATTNTEHREFALAIGVPADIYDNMNALHRAHNERIRAARAEWQAALGTAEEDAAARKLDNIMQADW